MAPREQVSKGHQKQGKTGSSRWGGMVETQRKGCGREGQTQGESQ